MRALIGRIGLFAAGLALVAMPAAAQTEKLRVALPQKGLWETSITILGEKAGIFKKAGIELDILHTRGGSETMQAVLAGSVDVARANGILGTIGGYSRGAPIRITAASMTGSPDAFWYARADSGIETPQDMAGKKIGFSRPGSSTHLIALAVLDHFNIKAEVVPSGGPSESFTQTMSGQIDLGWSVPPFRLDDIAAGKLRIVARGSDVTAMKDQTVRVNVTSASTLQNKRDLLVRFHEAWVQSLEYAYSDDQALKDYAEFAGVTVDVARETRDKFYVKESMQPYRIGDLELSLKQAHEYKFTTRLLTPDDVKGMIDILVKQ